ncbi:MAG: hypothetical protein GX117_01625 [Candidatus Hydrogenedentes bacterium]|nr:hypothetical protein [Candidatus Hydrogenedentota bacterium]
MLLSLFLNVFQRQGVGLKIDFSIDLNSLNMMIYEKKTKEPIVLGIYPNRKALALVKESAMKNAKYYIMPAIGKIS